jgi:hypothetical protein
MKIFITFFFLLSSTLSFACANLSKKPAYMGHKEIQCGKLIHKIIAPKMIIKGKAYPFALDLGDMWGDCPASNQSCYPPYLNIQRRGNAICKAYGMGSYAKSNSYSPLFHYSHSTPDVMARFKRVNGNSFAPALVRIDHSRSEYSEVRELWCYPNYRKR